MAVSTSGRDSGSTTSPCASTRSDTSSRRWRGTSTAGPSWNRSYRLARAERRSSSTSRIPRVVIRAVRAPFPSSSALVTTVVAWASHATAPGATPSSPVTVSSAPMTPRQKSRGVVGTLTTRGAPPASSTRTTSVNVPPMSTPMRKLMGEPERMG
jgi:hypothetical protein